jgi:hypothetical protein
MRLVKTNLFGHILMLSFIRGVIILNDGKYAWSLVKKLNISKLRECYRGRF